jgi:NAD(P)-dependent dehydrogenase (short-subunit alcohol dehydrogenase family)
VGEAAYGPDMGTIVVTGSAGGIGAATRARLEAGGHRVIGVDLRDAEVVADLATAEGREAMVEAVTAASDGALDGVVAAAGIRADDGAPIVSINHFGAVATLEGLRPLLVGRPSAAAVAVSSNSTTTQPGIPLDVVERCLVGDEDGARTLAGPDGIGAYGASKLALARWVRRQAPAADWIGAGIRLNAVAPGFIDTAMTEGTWDFISGLGKIFPVPSGRAGQPDEIAGVIAFLLSPDASYLCGTVLLADGGTEAAKRPDDWPAALA